MADPMREAYERAFTGSNRTAASWAAFKANWNGSPAGSFEQWWESEGRQAVGLESTLSFARRCWDAGRKHERTRGVVATHHQGPEPSDADASKDRP